jgi:hypothetical protein
MAARYHCPMDYETDETRDRWEMLCEQSTKEQDPVKLLQLITTINQILAEKNDRLNKSWNRTNDTTE